MKTKQDLWDGYVRVALPALLEQAVGDDGTLEMTALSARVADELVALYEERFGLLPGPEAATPEETAGAKVEDGELVALLARGGLDYGVLARHWWQRAKARLKVSKADFYAGVDRLVGAGAVLVHEEIEKKTLYGRPTEMRIRRYWHPDVLKEVDPPLYEALNALSHTSQHSKGGAQ